MGPTPGESRISVRSDSSSSTPDGSTPRESSRDLASVIFNREYPCPQTHHRPGPNPLVASTTRGGDRSSSLSVAICSIDRTPSETSSDRCVCRATVAAFSSQLVPSLRESSSKTLRTAAYSPGKNADAAATAISGSICLTRLVLVESFMRCCRSLRNSCRMYLGLTSAHELGIERGMYTYHRLRC